MTDERIFGRYPQKKKNEKTPVKWRVLDADGGEALLISEAVLDSRAYNGGESNVWAESDIRAWLNGGFYDAAFDADEQKMIVETENANNKGGDTRDRVFLLSADEANRYFKSDRDRTAKKTRYARKGFFFIRRKADAITPWWLRSSSLAYPEGAVVVNAGGRIHSDGYKMNAAIIGVRPCVRVKTDGI
ncbi:MAG: DUF6273 domain-containing protein [Clostridiales bacterium]|jgi:hypothetical protein|nr:DUF6273 domain-containing protein [Clostridiales bacterium]